MAEEHTYESMLRLFRPSDYYPMKFVCRTCESVVRYGDVYCSSCDKMLIWCEGRIRQRDNKVSFEIKV